jgi:septum site-determining protein MinC
MMSDKSAALAEPAGDECPVTLRGTTHGFEIHIESRSPADTVAQQIAQKLEQAPGFFSGGDVTLRFDDHPPRGYLGPIEEVTGRFDMRIVSVSGPKAEEGTGEKQPEAAGEPVEPVLAVGSEPLVSREEEKARASEAEADGCPPKMVVGPVRSGCILEVGGHLVVMGDVNPGAEVRAAGSIVVLGRLRGIAHAAADGGAGFILALELEPQQLRVGELVARADESAKRPDKAEIAYAKDGKILVENYAGRLPWGIATAKF